MSNILIDLDYEQINLGVNPDDGTGTTLRGGGSIINQNFSQTAVNFGEMRRYVEAIPTGGDGDGSGSGVTVDTNLLTHVLEANNKDIVGGQVVGISGQGVELATDKTNFPPIGIALTNVVDDMIRVAVGGIVDLTGIVSGISRGGVYYVDGTGNLTESLGTNHIIQIGVAIADNMLLINYTPYIAELPDDETEDFDVVLDDKGALAYRELTTPEKLMQYMVVESEYPYNGSLSRADDWLISNASGVTTTTSEILYANEANNPMYTTLKDAWDNRLTLNYVELMDLDI